MDGERHFQLTQTPARSPETTGSYLVLLAEDQVDAGVAALTDHTGISVQRVAGDEAPTATAELADEGAVVIEELGVAVVQSEPDRTRAMGVAASESSAILTVEPERVVYAIEEGLSAEYLRGFADAAARLAEVAGAGPAATAAPSVLGGFVDTDVTWGLQATGAASSSESGSGVRVAVLDTGFDSGHPDFAGRAVHSVSFVEGEGPEDGHGHGTHCIGTATGSFEVQQLPRYGIAHDAEILAGKVLSNAGRGADRGILAGIAWAVQNGARLISMSLGSAIAPGQPYSRVFEAAAQRAARAGGLIVAAAGNDSHRPAMVAPVGHPANCPAIMAVAALDSRLGVGWFSNGGQVDIAAPGVDVRSSWPRPTLYNTISGTSMATPHVAGIAALWLQARPQATPHDLWAVLVQRAKRLPLSSTDVGAGLVQAP